MTTQEQIINRYKECVQKGFDFYGLRISDELKNQKRGVVFDLSGKVAGQYDYNHPEYGDKIHIFRVNLKMAEMNLEDYLAETIPHEVAHYLDKLLHPKNTDYHGLLWGEIMIRVFNVSPKQYHNYHIPGYHIYKCACGKELEISPTIHHKILNGQRRYTNCCHHFLNPDEDYIGMVENKGSYLERVNN